MKGFGKDKLPLCRAGRNKANGGGGSQPEGIKRKSLKQKRGVRGNEEMVKVGNENALLPEFLG